MEQSQKDAATKAAWITGGFALAGTLITLLFTGGVIRGTATGTESPSPSSPTSSNSSVSPTSSNSSVVTEPPPSTFTQTPTPARLVPPEVVGNWYGGLQGQVNLHLRISDSANFLLLDANAPGSPGSGKVGFKGAIIELYGNDGSVARFPWSVEETPQGDVLHIGVANYLRE